MYSSPLLLANSPRQFWRLHDANASETDWNRASFEAAACFADLSWRRSGNGIAWTPAIYLGEEQFGPKHWDFGPLKQTYYRLRGVMPKPVRTAVRGFLAAKQSRGALLHWPIEERYVLYQFDMVRCLLANRGLDSARYLHFWPDGKRFAFVLTHDVETNHGQQFVREVAGLEESLGFRSSFNFVPELYPVDTDLLSELRERGFEVGVHGLKHDGKLFSSRATFEKRAQRINHYLDEWDAVGFRSPMTHRNPEWMQALEIEYDSSFFDTDPFEPMPGGTMSIWPFMMGRFVELPYTLVQDHTLTITLGETTPKLWLDKVEFIRRCCGMALSLTHPDYLRDPKRLAVYEQFLRAMRDRDDYWHALPREVARWWRSRAEAESLADLPGASVWEIRLAGDGMGLLPANMAAHGVPDTGSA